MPDFIIPKMPDEGNDGLIDEKKAASVASASPPPPVLKDPMSLKERVKERLFSLRDWALSLPPEWKVYLRKAAIAALIIIPLVFFGSLLFAWLIHRPIPEKICEFNTHDRFLVTIFEPAMRIFYFYPSKLCWNTQCLTSFTQTVYEAIIALGTTIVIPLTNPLKTWRDWRSPLEIATDHLDGVEVRTYLLPNGLAKSNATIVYMHGGGFLIGRAWMADGLMRDVAESVEPRLIVSIDYRRTPETVFPGAINDCTKVIQYLMVNGHKRFGIDPSKIVVLGDSAGGNLAAAMARRFANGTMGKYPLLGQVLVHPALQFSDWQTPSHLQFGSATEDLAFLNPSQVALFMLLYAGVDVSAHPKYIEAVVENTHVSPKATALRQKLMNPCLLPERFRPEAKKREEFTHNDELADLLENHLMDPDFAPLMATNLSGLPSALIITVETDILRDDGIFYAQRLEAAGVNVTWTHVEEGFHGVFHMHRSLDISARILSQVNTWIADLIRGHPKEERRLIHCKEKKTIEKKKKTEGGIPGVDEIADMLENADEDQLGRMFDKAAQTAKSLAENMQFSLPGAGIIGK